MSTGQARSTVQRKRKYREPCHRCRIVSVATYSSQCTQTQIVRVALQIQQKERPNIEFVKHWSSTQRLVVLSLCETELYVLNNERHQRPWGRTAHEVVKAPGGQRTLLCKKRAEIHNHQHTQNIGLPMVGEAEQEIRVLYDTTSSTD